MTPAIVKSVDDIPAVCLEEDLITIFRLSTRDMRLWRKFPEFIPFPPLPMLDRQIRVSGCVVAWFLAQEAVAYYRSFKSPLEDMMKGIRRNRPADPTGLDREATENCGRVQAFSVGVAVATVTSAFGRPRRHVSGLA